MKNWCTRRDNLRAAFPASLSGFPGQNDGVKKLRQLRKEIAQIKTVAKERELGIRGAAKDTGQNLRRRGYQKEPLNDGDSRSSAGAGDRRAA